MDLDNHKVVIAHQPCSISFGLYTAEEIRKISVVKCENPILFDSQDIPVHGGLYDPRLGALNRFERCETCGLNHDSCPGHFGHIDLAVPVYNVLFFDQMFKILRSKCFVCHHFRISRVKVHRCICKLKLIDAGLLVAAKDLDDVGFGFEEEETQGTIDSARKGKQDQLIHMIDVFMQPFMKEINQNKGKLTDGVQEYRKIVVADFLKTVPHHCENCRAPACTLKQFLKERIFQQQLTEKDKKLMESLGLKPENVFGDSSPNDDSDSHGQHFMPALEVQGHIRKLWEEEKEIVDLLWSSNAMPILNGHMTSCSNPDMFFIEAMLVPPIKFRPPNFVADGAVEHAQTSLFNKILTTNLLMYQNVAEKGKDKTEGKGSLARSLNMYLELQHNVNLLIDSTSSRPTDPKNLTGVRQIIEKKEGLFRKNMMGKRVNYAARSVISPDPNIATNEIGLPELFAKKLTYPQPVGQFNFKEMMKAVENGPDVWPGANSVQMGKKVILLSKLSHEERVAIAKTLLTDFSNTNNVDKHIKVVNRHVINGDIVIVNRQPTLHKPSVMTHKVRVLKGEKVLRLHYANCSSYNADFDGDEMNVHLPQSELARAEAYNISNTDSQYLVPSSGKPLRGLIQDHVCSGVLLTKRDTFISRETYVQLVWQACGDACADKHFVLERPAIFKPEPLWTGKQVMTTIITHLTKGKGSLNFTSKSRVAANTWPGEGGTEEATVSFVDGYHCTGVLDKNQFGATAYGLVHSCHELYGATLAGLLLTCLARLFSHYLRLVGVTCGIDDCVIKGDAETFRRDRLKQARACGSTVASAFLADDSATSLENFKGKATLPEPVLRKGLSERLSNARENARLDGLMKRALNEYQSKIIDRSLSHGQEKPFPRNNLSLMTLSGAKGSKVNFSQISCLLGQQELEGKRVPRMVNGKTLPCFAAYDTSARSSGYIQDRFLTGLHAQEYFFHCMAGREGLVDTAVKTANSGYLQRCLIKHMEGLAVQYDNTVRDSDNSVVQFNYGEDSVDPVKTSFLTQFKFLALNHRALLQRLHIKDLVNKVEHGKGERMMRKALKNPAKYDPVISSYSPARYVGSTSEAFHRQLKEYVGANPDALLAPNDSTDPKALTGIMFEQVMNLKYMSSLIEPGEAVGLLAAESIGEPSTQMTLNTFHLAGFGGANVTLGIPRLREILMTNGNTIATPAMTLPLRPDVSSDAAEDLSRKLYRLRIEEILREVKVTESMTRVCGRFQKTYTVRLCYLSADRLHSLFRLSPDEVTRMLEVVFVPALNNAVAKASRTKNTTMAVPEEDVGDVVIGAAAGKVEPESSAPAKPKAKDDYDSDEEHGDEGYSAHANRAAQRSMAYLEPDADEKALLAPADEEEEGKAREEVPTAAQTTTQKQRKDALLKLSSALQDYSFKHSRTEGDYFEIKYNVPAGGKKFLLLEIIDRLAKKTTVRAVSGIEKGMVLRNNDKVEISTVGVNLLAMFEYPELIDLDNIYTNDLASVLRVYGIEACRQAIIRETSGVFNVYGIGVDARHLSLVGDYMTATGDYRPFNRTGMFATSSPLQKISYETSTQFLKEATIGSGSLSRDAMKSPSACLVLGKVIDRVGTSACRIVCPVGAS